MGSENEDAGYSVRRRSLLGGAIASVALLKASGAGEAGPLARVKRDADALAGSMAGIHGGRWRVTIDHETPMIVIIADA